MGFMIAGLFIGPHRMPGISAGRHDMRLVCRGNAQAEKLDLEMGSFLQGNTQLERFLEKHIHENTGGTDSGRGIAL